MGCRLAIFTLYDVHALIAHRDGEHLYLEADDRRHAKVGNAIRDLNEASASASLSSGSYAVIEAQSPDSIEGQLSLSRVAASPALDTC